MRVTINSLNVLTFGTADTVDHDFLDFEVYYQEESIIVFRITAERKIETYFGLNMERFVIDLGVMEEIISKAKIILYQDFDEQQTSMGEGN